MLLRSRQHLELLDLYKFIASVLIFFHHYQQLFEIRYDKINFCFGQFSPGLLVELFFMISGFLTISGAAGREPGYWSRKNCASGWLHKALRIYPMAILSCLAYLILAHIYRHMTGTWPDGICDYGDLKTIICSLLLVICGVPGLNMLGVNNPVWYLSVLLLCYHGFYLILYVTDRLRIRPVWFFAAAFVLSLVGSELKYISILFPWNAQRGYICFFLGVLLGILIPHLSKKRGKQILTLGTVVLILGILLSIRLGRWGYVVRYQAFIEVILLYPLLILSAYCWNNARIPGSAFLGAVSYEIYLWHCVLIVGIRIALVLLGTELPETYRMMIIAGLLVFVWAITVYLAVERPVNRGFLSWEKRLSSRSRKAG